MSARFLRCVVCCAARTEDLLLRQTAWSGPVAQGKTAAFTRRDGHCVGDGDVLPGGREEVRDAGMQVQKKRKRREAGNSGLGE